MWPKEHFRKKEVMLWGKYGKNQQVWLALYTSHLRLKNALTPSPVLLRACSSEFPRISSHLLHMNHRHALEKAIGNINWITSGTKFKLDWEYQSEDKVQQEEPCASKTTDSKPSNPLSLSICFTSHCFKTCLLQIKLAKVEQYGFQTQFFFPFWRIQLKKKINLFSLF